MSDCDYNYYCFDKCFRFEKRFTTAEEVCFSLFKEEYISVPSLGILLP